MPCTLDLPACLPDCRISGRGPRGYTFRLVGAGRRERQWRELNRDAAEEGMVQGRLSCLGSCICSTTSLDDIDSYGAGGEISTAGKEKRRGENNDALASIQDPAIFRAGHRQPLVIDQ